jgi:predicted Zn-dependent protease
MRAVLLALIVSAQAAAQVPDSGRWQELRFGAEEVGSDMEERYIEQVVELAAHGRLDHDRVLLQRLQRIAAGLIQAAVVWKPAAADWPWEIHLTDDPDIDAVCLAGGKLLVGSAFVGALQLDDGELAVLLAHEIAHAIAEHQRETLSEALLESHRPELPLQVVAERLASDLSLQFRLHPLSAIQEREADQLGMVIAHAAHWPTTAMLSFYRKLAASGGDGALSASHPAALTRVRLAEGMARLLGD